MNVHALLRFKTKWCTPAPDEIPVHTSWWEQLAHSSVQEVPGSLLLLWGHWSCPRFCSSGNFFPCFAIQDSFFCSNETTIASFFSFPFFLRLSLQCLMSFQRWPCLGFTSWTPCNSAPHLFGLQLWEGTSCYTACMTCSPHFCSPFCVSEALSPAWTYLSGSSAYLLCWDHVLCASCFVLPHLCSLCAPCSVLPCCQHESVWLCSCPW